MDLEVRVYDKISLARADVILIYLVPTRVGERMHRWMRILLPSLQYQTGISQESHKDLACVEGSLERGLNSEKLYGGQAPEAGIVPYLQRRRRQVAAASGKQLNSPPLAVQTGMSVFWEPDAYSAGESASLELLCGLLKNTM